MVHPIGRGASAALAVAATLLWAAPAAAQRPERREGYQEITPARFLELPVNFPDGEKFTLTYVKFNKQFEEVLKLSDHPELDDLLLVRDPDLRRRLEGNVDAEGAPIRAGRTNLQVFGRGERQPGGRYALVVDRVVALESDPARVRRRVEALGPDDRRGRLALARWIREEVYPTNADEEQRAALVAIVRRLVGEAREIQRRSLPPLPGGAEAWIAFGLEHDVAEPVIDAWADERVPEALRDRAAAALRDELGSRRYLGEWVTYAEYKRRLGYVQDDDGDWVRAVRQRFIERCTAERQRLKGGGVIEVLSEVLLHKARAKGEVVKGMTKDMVLGTPRSTPAGRPLSPAPVYVDRIRERRRNAQGGFDELVWEQWVMEDGLEVLFYEGLVYWHGVPQASSGGGGDR